MSALPPKADIAGLFDHLVGAGEQRARHVETKPRGSYFVGACTGR
jgi:hypothetical protein